LTASRESLEYKILKEGGIFTVEKMYSHNTQDWGAHIN